MASIRPFKAHGPSGPEVTFVLRLQTNTLQSQDRTMLTMFGFVHHTVRALTDSLQLLILVHPDDSRCYHDIADALRAKMPGSDITEGYTS